MSEKLMRTRNLVWKEWRARRWTLAALAGVMVVAWIIGTFKHNRMEPAETIFFGLFIAAGVLGVGFFSREELDESRSFLHTLPLSRGQIFRIKLATGLKQLAVLMTLGLFLAIPYLRHLGLNDVPEFRETLKGISMVAPLLFVLYFSCAIALYHVRRSLTAFIFGSAAAVLFACLLMVEPILANALSKELGWSWVWLVQDVVAAALLAGWLGFLYCRTPLTEQSSTARFFLWVLWVVAFLELFALLFFTGWRDLFYLLTGV